MILSYKRNTCDVFAEFETKNNDWSLKISMGSGSPEEFLIQNEKDQSAREFMDLVDDRYKKNKNDNGMIVETYKMLLKTKSEVTLLVVRNTVFAKA